MKWYWTMGISALTFFSGMVVRGTYENDNWRTLLEASRDRSAQLERMLEMTPGGISIQVKTPDGSGPSLEELKSSISELNRDQNRSYGIIYADVEKQVPAKVYCIALFSQTSCLANDLERVVK